MCSKRTEYSLIALAVLAFVILGSRTADAGTPIPELQKACWAGDKAAVERLIDSGADVNARDGSGISPICAAATGGNAEVYKLLLSKGAKSDTAKCNPLTNAVTAKKIEMVEFLLKNGADVNAADSGSLRTPLHYASMLGNAQICRLLIKYHANVNARAYGGETPLMMTGDVEIMQTLIENGADLSAKKDSGETVLTRGFSQDRPEAVALLIRNGADVKAVNSRSGKTALLEACEKGHVRTIEVLLQNGANPNDRYTLEACKPVAETPDERVQIGEAPVSAGVAPAGVVPMPAAKQVAPVVRQEGMTALMVAAQGGLR